MTDVDEQDPAGWVAAQFAAPERFTVAGQRCRGRIA